MGRAPINTCLPGSARVRCFAVSACALHGGSGEEPIHGGCPGISVSASAPILNLSGLLPPIEHTEAALGGGPHHDWGQRVGSGHTGLCGSDGGRSAGKRSAPSQEGRTVPCERLSPLCWTADDRPPAGLSSGLSPRPGQGQAESCPGSLHSQTYWGDDYLNSSIWIYSPSEKDAKKF